MHTLVLGGIRSGKSRWAESAIAGNKAVGDPVSYIATGPIRTDPDWTARVDAHRRRRLPWWHTVETADVASQLRARPGVPTLIDDLGNWLTATLDRCGWDNGSAEPEMFDLVAAVRSFPSELVLVSPEVGLSVVPDTASGRRFADELGALNQLVAQSCDRVVLVVAGQPLWVKPAGMEGGC